jgi:hypothetical protein
MPWTRKQVKYLLSSGSPLSSAQQTSMKQELHADPSLGHKPKSTAKSSEPPNHLGHLAKKHPY